MTLASLVNEALKIVQIDLKVVTFGTNYPKQVVLRVSSIPRIS
jgi:hypothetical protein